MPETAPSEVDLWRRAQGGDGQARERLVELASSVARGELRRRGVEVSVNDDLAQEVVRSTLVFVAKGGDAPRDLRAFLKYRTWGVLSDHRKRMRAALPQVDLGTLSEPTASGPGPQSLAALRQLVLALEGCKEKLSEEQRVTIELRYSARLDADELAARLGVHRNTIHVRVFRALAQLRECLTRKGFDPEDLES